MQIARQALGRKYASAAIQERRARIAAVARRLIIEKGPDGFSMSEVSMKAGVAEKTLYNVVGNRNNLIAQAVEAYQRELRELAALRQDYDIGDVLSSLTAMCDRLVSERGWAKAIAQLYFSPDIDEVTHATLRAVARTHIEPSIRLFAERGHLLPSAKVDQVTHHFANTAYSLVHDWACGRIASDAFSLHISFAMLSALFLVVLEPARHELSELMHQAASRLASPTASPQTP